MPARPAGRSPAQVADGADPVTDLVRQPHHRPLDALAGGPAELCPELVRAPTAEQPSALVACDLGTVAR